MHFKYYSKLIKRNCGSVFVRLKAENMNFKRFDRLTFKTFLFVKVLTHWRCECVTLAMKLLSYRTFLVKGGENRRTRENLS